MTDKFTICSHCGGSGSTRRDGGRTGPCPVCEGHGGYYLEDIENRCSCPRCNGTGNMASTMSTDYSYIYCTSCGGTGRARRGSEYPRK